MSREQDQQGKRKGTFGLPLGPEDEPIIRVRIRDEDLRSITGGIGAPAPADQDQDKSKQTPPPPTA